VARNVIDEPSEDYRRECQAGSWHQSRPVRPSVLFLRQVLMS
jgi:hypothetical protein